MIDHFRHATDQPTSCSEFLAVMEKTVRCLDQMLGYQGNDRFVVYYYEPRGEEVVWRDSTGYGFVTGAWSTFMDEVAPVAEHYTVDVGCNGSPGTHVLLIDRRDRRAYFAERRGAVQFLAGIAEGNQTVERGAMPPADHRVPAEMVEITHEAVRNLAHQIWERKGRPAGQELADWLEAEAALRRRSAAPASKR